MSIDLVLRDDIPLRREKVFALMAEFEAWEIAHRLRLPETIVKRDITFIEKKVSAEKEALNHLTRLRAYAKELMKKYLDSEYPENIEWAKRYQAQTKQIGDYLRTADIVFLHKGEDGEIPQITQKSMIATLREIQLKGEEERKKKKEVMR